MHVHELLPAPQGAGWVVEDDGVLRTKRVQQVLPERDGRTALAQFSEYVYAMES